jgi:hypothetical protein
VGYDNKYGKDYFKRWADRRIPSILVLSGVAGALYVAVLGYVVWFVWGR